MYTSVLIIGFALYFFILGLCNTVAGHPLDTVKARLVVILI